MRFGYLFAALTFVLPATAAELYTFTYTRTNSTFVIQNFTFSFSTAGVAQPPANAGGFMTGTGGFTITPFTVTDNSNNMFVFTQARVDFNNNVFPDLCFTFGSASENLNASCGPTGSGSALIFGFSPVPVTTGGSPYSTVAGQFQGVFSVGNEQVGDFSGSAKLTISDIVNTAAPEPSSIFLMVAGLAGLAWMMRRRTRTVRDRSA